jgi:two-component system sensor histidine kinase UhpB
MPRDTTNVLSVEDNAADARIMQELLAVAADSFELQTTETLAGCLAALGESQFDIVVLDLSLPDSLGLATFTTVQQAARCCPIVVVSGLDERTLALEAVKLGAQDYLVKDQLNSELLIRSLTYAIERGRLQESLRSSEEHFRQLAESIRDVFWIYDVEIDRLTYISPAYESIWGQAPSELPMTPEQYFANVYYDDRASIAKVFSDRATTDGYDEEYRIARPDGDLRWIRDRAVPLSDEQNRVYRVVGIAEDTTVRKELEHQVLEAATREQHRISRDLHDGVGQELTGLGYMAQSLSRKLAAKSETESEIARAIAEASQNILGEVRNAIRGLTPVELDSHGLMAALEQLIAVTRERFDIQCRFTYDQPVLIEDNTTATHLFRIAQEAINNSVKHAEAREILLDLNSASNHIEMTVQDDGVGFDQQKPRHSGLGLNTMKYRARAIGATLKIISSTGAGAKVVCTYEQCTNAGSNEQFTGSMHLAHHDR